jgi:hypothetical protein
MSIIETLTEGVVNRNMEREGAALLNKWSQTGLLEGLDAGQKQNMAVLLENQAKALLKEANSMTSGPGIEGFAAVAFPIVRRVFAGLIANDLVSVQPMSLPSGLIFFMDFVFSDDLAGTASQLDTRFGNAKDKSIYGTDRVGSEITGGVNLVGSSLKENFSGPREAVGYAYASPTTSIEQVTSGHTTPVLFDVSSSMTQAQLKYIKFDADILAEQTSGGTAATHKVITWTVPKADLPLADFDNLSAFDITDAELVTAWGTGVAAKLVRRLTSAELVSGTPSVRFVATQLATSTAFSSSVQAAYDIEVPKKDDLSEKSGGLGALNDFNYPLEGNGQIPEIDIKVDSIAITAQTKKLKAKWTPELGQDLNAYHNIDAEVELTSILSEQIALEIDREILADLVNGATAATYYWSRSPGLFLNRQTGAEIGSGAAAPDFTGTVSEWYETLIETINDVSAQIHRKTLRGGATHIVCSPEVANILEFTAGFRANVTADADKGDIGAVKVGSLNRKFDVIVDPYFPRNVVLVARIGSSFLESGYVYAPYVPLQTTPTIFGPEDFVPRKGVMTRYAKKMVRPDMYGLVICRGLLGESGS